MRVCMSLMMPWLIWDRLTHIISSAAIERLLIKKNKSFLISLTDATTHN